MLEEINPLPGSDRHPAVDDWNGKLHLCECSSNMSRHVIRSLVIMCIRGRVLRGYAHEIPLKIAAHGRRGVFLNE